MQSYLKEICVETLRAQYAELLRLRKYVERLEKLHSARSNSGASEDDIRGEKPSRRVVGLFG